MFFIHATKLINFVFVTAIYSVGSLLVANQQRRGASIKNEPDYLDLSCLPNSRTITDDDDEMKLFAYTNFQYKIFVRILFYIYFYKQTVKFFHSLPLAVIVTKVHSKTTKYKSKNNGTSKNQC